jgi:hypothetical protein
MGMSLDTHTSASESSRAACCLPECLEVDPFPFLVLPDWLGRPGLESPEELLTGGTGGMRIDIADNAFKYAL